MKFRFLPKHADRQAALAQEKTEKELAALRSTIRLLTESHVNTLEHFAHKTRTQFGKGQTPWNKGRKNGFVPTGEDFGMTAVRV